MPQESGSPRRLPVRQMRRVPVEERVRRAEVDAAAAAEQQEQQQEQVQEAEETIADRMRKRRRLR